MRKNLFSYIFIILFCAFSGFKANAVLYYYQGGDPKTLGNWNTILLGGGSSPAAFNLGDGFNFRKRGAIVSCPAGNWTANWTVGGASFVTIGDGGANAFALTVPSGFKLTGSVT